GARAERGRRQRCGDRENQSGSAARLHATTGAAAPGAVPALLCCVVRARSFCRCGEMTMTIASRMVGLCLPSATGAMLLAALWAAPLISAQSSNARWVTAWSTSQQALGEDRITNATVRMIARVTTPGDAVRVRLDNAYGTEPVTIGRAYVGHRRSEERRVGKECRARWS